MSLADTERAFLELCCQPTAPEPSGVLDAEHGKIWGVYRQMVRGRFLEEIKLGLRRTLNAAGEPALSEMFMRFMAETPPRSRAFYGVVPEFAAFAAARWSEDTASSILPTSSTVPAWVADLARYEAARYQVADLPAQRSRPVVEFDFDRVPVVHSAVVLLSLGYRVHRDPAADGSYEKAPTELCVYRAADERTVGAYVLNRFNATCLRAWQVGATVSQSVRNVSEAQGTPADAKVIDALCTALSDLMERGVVLGSQP